ncbi:MAG: hypothetical protein M0R22_04245, partial [Dehalococcoidia bacterium]|nr:hypothetical protein [Dehalococcoidia bacterium]
MDAKKWKTQLIPGTGGLVKRAVATLATAAIPRLGRESPAGEFAANTFLLMDIAAHCRNATEHIMVCSGGDLLVTPPKTLYMLSVGENAWTSGPEMPADPFCYGAARMDDGRIFIFGGKTIYAGRSGYVFDPVRGGWEVLPLMHQAPVVYKLAGVARVGDRIYVFGGSDGRVTFCACETLPANMHEWVDMAPMPTARSDMGVVTIGHRIYAVGGLGNDYDFLSVVEKLDTVTGTWTTLPSMPNATAWMAIAVIDDRFIWVLGGYIFG